MHLIQPTLIGIMRGAIPSEHHRVYEGGSNTEKSKLRVGAIRGPLKKRWKDYKVVKLIQEVLLPIAREEKKTLGYVQDVLLPEVSEDLEWNLWIRTFKSLNVPLHQ